MNYNNSVYSPIAEASIKDLEIKLKKKTTTTTTSTAKKKKKKKPNPETRSNTGPDCSPGLCFR